VKEIQKVQRNHQKLVLGSVFLTIAPNGDFKPIHPVE
jgi:hypothetical protein